MNHSSTASKRLDDEQRKVSSKITNHDYYIYFISIQSLGSIVASDLGSNQTIFVVEPQPLRGIVSAVATMQAAHTQADSVCGVGVDFAVSLGGILPASGRHQHPS